MTTTTHACAFLRDVIVSILKRVEHERELSLPDMDALASMLMGLHALLGGDTGLLTGPPEVKRRVHGILTELARQGKAPMPPPL